METPIKTLACSAAISIVLLACGETDDNNQEQCSISIIDMGHVSIDTRHISSGSSIWEMPVMDSRVKAFRGYLGGIDPSYNGLGYSLGDFKGIGIGITTDKSMLMSVFPNIFENEQAECNYFAIIFSYHSGHPDSWILSQDMVLNNITPTPANLAGCAFITAPTVEVMLVCDDSAEGNLKDKIDIDSIRSYTDPSLNCRNIKDDF